MTTIVLIFVATAVVYHVAPNFRSRKILYKNLYKTLYLK